MWVRMWRVRSLLRVEAYPHPGTPQAKGRSPVWMRMWRVRSEPLAALKRYLHPGTPQALRLGLGAPRHTPKAQWLPLIMLCLSQLALRLQSRAKLLMLVSCVWMLGNIYTVHVK